MATRTRLVTGAALSSLLICGSLASGTAMIHAAGGKHARTAQTQVHRSSKAVARNVSFTGFLAAMSSTSPISPTATTPMSATLTVNTGHGQVMVNVTDKTRIVRRFNGASSLDELSMNDHLQVIGRRDGTQTVDAGLIRDLSIENNDGLLFAKVTKVDPAALTVVSARHGRHAAFAAGQTFTLPISTTTTIIVSGTVKQGDDSAIKQGDMVRADGVFDTRSHTFISTKRVVDLSSMTGEDEETTTTTSTTTAVSTTGTTTTTTTTGSTTTTTTTSTTTTGTTTTGTTTGTTTTGTTTSSTTTSPTAGVQGLTVRISGRVAMVKAPAAGGTTTTVILWLHGNRFVSLPVTAATTIAGGTLSDLAGKFITAVAVYDPASRTFSSVTSISVQA